MPSLKSYKQSDFFAPFKFDRVGDFLDGVFVETPREVAMPNKFKGGQLETTMPCSLRLTRAITNGAAVDCTDATTPVERTIYPREGSILGNAIADAVLDSNNEWPAAGGRLTVQFTEEQPTDKGNPAKIYKAQYVPPAPGNVATTLKSDTPADDTENYPNGALPDPFATGDY